MVKNKVIKAYLAHTLVLRFEVLTKITPMIRRVGICDVNPFYTKNGKPSRTDVAIADEMTKKGINPRENKDWMNRVKKKARWIVNRDLEMLSKSNMVIAYMLEPSMGTTCEIFFSGKILKKPVFLLTSSETETIRHPWIYESCRFGGIFTNLKDLEMALQKFMEKQKHAKIKS